jgi:osmotically-inducible protein OsmY
MSKIIDDLAVKVENAIIDHKAFKEHWNVNVINENGIIMLQGKVPSKQYVELAENIARQQDGVESVINELDIDEDLQEETKLKVQRQNYVPPSRHH